MTKPIDQNFVDELEKELDIVLSQYRNLMQTVYGVDISKDGNPYYKSAMKVLQKARKLNR